MLLLRETVFTFIYIYIQHIHIYTTCSVSVDIPKCNIPDEHVCTPKQCLYIYIYIYIHIEPSNTYPNLHPKASKIETKKKHDFWDLHRLHFHSATLDFHSHAFLVPKELPTWWKGLGIIKKAVKILELLHVLEISGIPPVTHPKVFCS